MIHGVGACEGLDGLDVVFVGETEDGGLGGAGFVDGVVEG